MRRELEKELAEKVNRYQINSRTDFTPLPKENAILIGEFLKFALNNPIDSVKDIPEKFNEILNA